MVKNEPNHTPNKKAPIAGIRVIMNYKYLKVDETTSDTKIKTVIKSDEIKMLTSIYWKLASKMRITRSKNHYGYYSSASLPRGRL